MVTITTLGLSQNILLPNCTLEYIIDLVSLGIKVMTNGGIFFSTFIIVQPDLISSDFRS